MQKQKINFKIGRVGFTLIEILLVIGIIAMLASIVIVAVNPARQFAQARNTQRWSNVNAILNAVHQYAVDNQGSLPSTITASSMEICKTGVASSTCIASSLVVLTALTDEEKYLISIPVDPACPAECNVNGTGYNIMKSTTGRITVAAPHADLDVTISVTR